ncbi:ABC-type transporter, periplasmic subunit [Tepidanaerobacter acetatoxydans Re1]|uniref:ABC-type transporter, periplasmic subunit n=1 Tax=Tepidanaerobacter acetatoxydans (strain DSM 21804 / JCM 16047 / Re1) TaxID=1209989 RepID=F4LWY6_TEPAE|nr:peptide ABC transporter substrate-binding protein [Tepidanaerobacter acetatoxydans]AEE90964.1 ABC-type transporter, periplasmic subunit [Tepidanaerobacter acetatoxydans Re1]CCP25558.1 ABC-type transporter, periplasmic subunit [Tepidanaerobacter acetatoxydans Re1]
MFKTRRLAVLTVVLLALSLVVTGCSSGVKEDAATEKDEYSTVYSGEITTLNYLITSTTSEFALAANMVDTLIDYDKYGVVQPCLATEWNVSEDKLVWTFKLRKGVKWFTHDGKEYAEVTAQDFVDAMKYILDQAHGSQTANIAYRVIKNAEKFYNGEITDFDEVGVKAVDDYILEYTLEKPIPYFLSMLTYVCFFPVNGQFLEEVKDKFGTDNVNFLYNGAYIMETFEPQTKRVLVANENYWDKDNVHIKKLNYIYNKEAATLAPELFLRGDIDYADIPSSVLDEWMKDSEKKDLIRPNRTNFYTYFYALNFNPHFAEEYEPENWKTAVNNVNFRKSIFHAFDRKAAMLTSEPYNPEYRFNNSITPKNFVDLNGTDYTRLNGLAEFSNTDSFNRDIALEYKEKAVTELKGKAMFPIKILMPYNTGVTEWTNRAQVVEQQLENLLGTDYIDVIIEPYPPTGFLDATRRSGNYALLECNWGPDYADPETYTDPFSPDSNYNWPQMAQGYTEANGKTKYENMVDSAKTELLDIEERYTLFAEAEAFLIEQAFVIPYSVGGGGYSASRLNPFESPYSPFGVSSERFKGQKILDKPMNTEEFNAELERWEKERAESLKKAAQ